MAVEALPLQGKDMMVAAAYFSVVVEVAEQVKSEEPARVIKQAAMVVPECLVAFRARRNTTQVVAVVELIAGEWELGDLAEAA